MNKIYNKKHYFSELTTTAYPWCNMRVDLESALRDEIGKTTVDIRYGDNLKDTNKRIYLNHAGTYNMKGKSFKTTHEAQFTYKALVLICSNILNHISV